MKLPKDACPICLENIDKAASVVHPCNHTFCCTCIDTWATHKATCPLCLQPFLTISVQREEEDTKEEIVQVRGNSKDYALQEEEDFECLDHAHFLKEFQALYKQAKETERELETRIMSKRRQSKSEKDYQLILHAKQEIELKLNFLEQEKKIFPKELLQEIQHFSSIIKKMQSGENTPHIEGVVILHNACEEEDEYYISEAKQNREFL